MNIDKLLTEKQNDKIYDIYEDVNTKYGDSGSCVMGYKLRVRQVYTIPQMWQGSTPNDVFFKRVKEYLLTEKDEYNQPFTEDDFSIDYGYLD